MKSYVCQFSLNSERFKLCLIIIECKLLKLLEMFLIYAIIYNTNRLNKSLLDYTNKLIEFEQSIYIFGLFESAVISKIL